MGVVWIGERPNGVGGVSVFGVRCPDSNLVECEMGVWEVGGDMGNMEKGWGREGRTAVLMLLLENCFFLFLAAGLADLLFFLLLGVVVFRTRFFVTFPATIFVDV
jgi:hypothetical protein